MDEKCGTEKCEGEATCIVYWPGRVMRFCAACAVRAHTIARAMGFEVEIQAMDPRLDDEAAP
jgi:hypothetical protein